MGKARAGTKPTQVTLDAGALIAIDRGDRRVIALIEQVLARGGSFNVPAGVLGQAWRDGRRQAMLGRFVRSSEVRVVPLDEELSRACGELLAVTRTNDVIDASVVLVARKGRDLIVTSDPEDLARLDSAAVLAKV